MSKECIDCKNRYVGCHDVCKAYQEYKRNTAKAKKQRQKDFAYKDYVSNRLWRERR